MAKTDFFDDDLKSSSPKEIKIGAGERSTGTLTQVAKPENIPGRPVSDLNLTRMAQHKKEVDENVANAVQELERLKKRQENLERQKKTLEDLRTKQADFENGRTEMMDHLRQSLVILEKDEIQSSNYAQLLHDTRERFRAMLTELEDIDENSWPEGQLREGLNDALAVIDSARVEYNKATAKIDGIKSTDKKSTGHDPIIFPERRPHEIVEEKTFGYWFKAGLAASLPIILTAVLLMALYVYLRANGLI